LARIVSLMLLALCACNATHADDEAWASPERFEIGLTTSACFGTCPVYQMSVDERGRLHFYGKAWVEKPGSYDTDVSVTDVKQLYADMLQSGFVRMQDSYVSEADGCSLATDAPTSCFSEQHEAVLEKLRDLEEQIESSVLERFLGSRPLDYCRDKTRPPLPGGSYVLKSEDGDGDLGVLSVVEESTGVRWSALSCDGAQFSQGNVLVANCEMFLVPPDDVTLQWPGLERRQSAVRIGTGDEVGVDGALALHVMELEDEHAQVGRTGSACAN
jgi:hypothetical protein